MTFNDHSALEGQHAILSPSRYHWLNYSDDQLRAWVRNCKAVSEGIETHDFARRCIERGVKLPKRKKTLNLYVNDVINHGLMPEQVLYYSPYCFGTADAIGVTGQTLYIFDLKTGTSKADFRQLEIYAGLFALEYADEWPIIDRVVLRIYQTNAVRELVRTPVDVQKVADRIVDADLVLSDL